MTVGQDIAIKNSLRAIYLSSLLFFILDLDVHKIPDKILPVQGARGIHGLTNPRRNIAQSIDNIWETFKCKPTVKSLTKLCIRQVRKSMSSLDDSSFQEFASSVCDSEVTHAA